MSRDGENMMPILALTLLSALGSGLMAGLFFAFSVCVMKALARLPAAQGIAAMQAINIVIINPIFLAVFLGTGVLGAAAAVIALPTRPGADPIYLIAGALLYLAGSIAVTMIFNVPLNNALAAVAPESAEGANIWRRYLVEWNAWNHVRTVACILAMAAFIVALG
jgi:uncharacterized membrane protein